MAYANPLDIPTRVGGQHAAIGRAAAWGLASLCLCAGIAPLAARWIPDQAARLSYGVLLTALFLGLTLALRQSAKWQHFWELPFAFFVLAFVQVLNNAIPPLVSAYVLHEAPTAGDPLGSTVGGSAAIQLLEMLIAIVPVVILTKASGRDLGSLYIRTGSVGKGLAIAVVVFIGLVVLAASGHSQRLFPTNGLVTAGRFLALAPALFIVALSNGLEEEVLFRGLFLRKYSAFFGACGANVLQAVVFAVAHAGISYTPVAVLFIVLIVFPLGLITGTLMHRTNGILAPSILHAAFDIPIYLAFLTFAS